MKKIVQRLVLFVLLAVLFTACGSGGGGDNGPSPSQGQTPKTDVYLFYQGSLTAVDPASSPTNTIVISVETGTVSGVAPIEHGRYNSGTVSDLHNRTIIYAKGANLYKVSALKGATPTPVQLSSEAGVTSVGICYWYTASDYADHNNAQYIYELPGTDGDCSTFGDNVDKMVKVGMTATDAPITSNVGWPLTELRNMSTGALIGWLVLNGTNLYRYNADFGSPTLAAAGINDACVVALAPSGKVFLWVQTATIDLKLYNPADDTLSSSLHAFSSGLNLNVAASDGSNLYFLDGDRAIYKVPLDGSSAATSFYSASGNTVFDGVMLTANRVVTLATDTVSDVPSIVTIPVSSGTATTVKTGVSGDWLSPLATAGSRIYYFSITDGAGTVSEDGSGKTEYANGIWSGMISPASKTLGQHETVSSMVLSDLTATPELRVYDAATHVVSVNTGTLPAGVGFIGFSGLANRGSILGNSDTGDIFLINTRTDNSLVRITNTPGTESVVGGGCIYNPMARFDPLFAILLLSSIVHLLKRRYARRH